MPDSADSTTRVAIPEVRLRAAPRQRRRLVRRTLLALGPLLVLVAATAFGLGYWLGGLDAKRGIENARSAQGDS